MRLILSILFLLLITPISFGAITIQNINLSRVSQATGPFFGNLNVQTNIMYGGIAGNCGSNTTSGSTCNSCSEIDTEATEVPACNRQRIHDDLLFEITLITDSPGVVLVSDDRDDVQQPLVFTTNVPVGIPVVAGTIFTVRIRWEEICRKIFGMDGGCASGSSPQFLASPQRIRIGIDEEPFDTRLNTGEFLNELQFVIADFAGDNAGRATLCNSSTPSDTPGICNFTAYPGDSKIFLEDIRASCSFPQVEGSGASVEFIRVFYQEASLGFPNLSEGEVADLEVKNEAVDCSSTKPVSLINSEVTGLVNGNTYAFAVGVVDQAKNVGYVTYTLGTISDEAAALAPDNTDTCFNPEGNELGQNCHVATPDEVIGLIQKEFDCFITTATYGSPFRPKVEDFRQFRNVFLKTNWLGRKVINFYYRNSPPIAHWIRSNPDSKPWMRLVLWPFWLFAKVCLDYPICLLLVLFGLMVIKRRKSIFGGIL